MASVTQENFKSLQDSHFPCLRGQTVVTQEKRETSGEAEKSGHFLVNWPDPHPAWAQCFGLWYAGWPRMKGNSKRGMKSLWHILIPRGTEEAGRCSVLFYPILQHSCSSAFPPNHTPNKMTQTSLKPQKFSPQKVLLIPLEKKKSEYRISFSPGYPCMVCVDKDGLCSPGYFSTFYIG